MKKKEISPRDLLNWMIMFRQIILLLFFIFLSSQSFADQNDKRLNRLFDKLIVTEDQLEIEKLTQQIWKIWHEIDDPRMTRALVILGSSISCQIFHICCVSFSISN